MPNVTAYIRAGDMPKWRNLKNKSQALHDMLNSLPPGAFKQDFSRDAYLVEQRSLRARERGEDRRSGLPVITEHPPAPPMQQPKPELAFTGDQNNPKPEVVVKPAPSRLTEKLPASIRNNFINASSIPTPPQKAATPTEEQPCCKEPNPCKHWAWDGLEQAYRNTISNRLKAPQ